MKKTNKFGKSANPTVKGPIFVGNKAAEVATKVTGKQKKMALKKMCKSCK